MKKHVSSFLFLIVALTVQAQVNPGKTASATSANKSTPVAATNTKTSASPVLAALANDMVTVTGGMFTMGCTLEQVDAAYNNEKPAHSITVNGFKISKYEVTQALWREVMGNNPSSFKDCDNCPVENVSWNTAQDFIKALNAKTGMKYRLPTEAEWEYAARGGNQSKTFIYSGGSYLKAVGWYKDNSDSKTHPVGQRQANELGLFDMAGNVWEWCNDWYDGEYYAGSPLANPKGAGGGIYRVVRGGSWSRYGVVCRVATRYYIRPEYTDDTYGLRLAHDL